MTQLLKMIVSTDAETQTSRSCVVEFESNKKLKGTTLREILRDTSTTHEDVKSIYVTFECGEVKMRIYITPTLGIFDRNYLSITTEPEENAVAVELFKILREWAVTLFLPVKYASTGRRAFWYSSLISGVLLGMLVHRVWDFIKGELDPADYIVFNAWNIIVVAVTAAYITKLSETKFNGIAIGRGVEEVRKRKEHIKLYFEDLPLWFTLTMAAIVLTEVVDYFVKYNAKP